MNKKGKNTLIILFISAFFPLIGIAQGGWGGGLSLGTVMSQVDGDAYGGYKKIGLHAGFFAYYNFKKRWAIQPEVHFVQRGSREVVKGYLHWRFNYIDIQPLINFDILNIPGKVKLKIHAGPGVGVLLWANNGFKPVVNDFTGEFRKYSLEAVYGFDFQFMKYIGLIIRHANSLLSFSKYSTVWQSHRYFTVALRFVYPRE